MNRTVSSKSTYIVPPSTNGLTRSPPGVATAEKMAIPRITNRRDARSRSEVRIPTRDRPTSRIGNSMTSPKARNIVVTKSKYGPAASALTSVGREAEQERDRERQDDVGDRRRRARRTPARAGSTAGRARRSSGVSPGETNAHSWYRRTGIARMMPTTIEILSWIDEGVARARGTGAGRRRGAARRGTR